MDSQYTFGLSNAHLERERNIGERERKKERDIDR